MATQLDLEEQEQLDQLKAFWNQYGNLISGLLIVAALAYLGWFGWNWYQRDQGTKAASMYDEFEKAQQAADAERAGRIFSDMKERFPRAAFTGQAGLAAAKLAGEKGQADAARADLAWVAEKAAETEYRTIAKLRLAGQLLDEKKYDEALKQLDGVDAAEFQALAFDRRGDVLTAQGKGEEAKAAYQKAWAAMDAKVDYRRVVEAKLNVLGVDPAASAASGAGSAK
ncbi:MAG: tetratricopeptide repeat protein [Burkholderiales bacterium]|nr:tetratricopeptide repeat protein [Burkholderiales bacterium]